jgi:hypothetical protein
MDHELIGGWNERVRNGDSVIVVADLAVADDADYPDCLNQRRFVLRNYGRNRPGHHRGSGW